MSQANSRRRFLKSGAALSSTGFVASLEALQMRQAHAAQTGQAAPVASPYGPLVVAHDNATGLPLLKLPEGFEYTTFGWTGDPMDNGMPTPSNHDGMGVIWAEQRGNDVDVVLVRNHERGGASSQIMAPSRYDTSFTNTAGTRVAGGGTTNLVFRGRSFRGSYASLGGTLTNCAGGQTPWGTWPTCEETLTNLGEAGQPGKKHGYVFEVRKEPNATTGKPIVAKGRFSHEAVAVDPKTRYAYLTEDLRNASGFYRFVPSDTSGTPGSYEKGGTLQMARIKGQPNADLIASSRGEAYDLEWVTIADPDASRVLVSAVTPTLNPVAGLTDIATNAFISGPFAQGWTAGGLRMSRGEGIWYHGGKVYIVDTATGFDAQARRGRGDGAVWELDLATDRLRAIFVSTNILAGDNPDNITVSPRGGILLCEDGDGADDAFGFGMRLMGLTPQGESFIFCKNNVELNATQVGAAGKLVAAGDYRDFEFCGACFDPSGKVLFVNIQSPGITFAIWGPWARGTL